MMSARILKKHKKEEVGLPSDYTELVHIGPHLQVVGLADQGCGFDLANCFCAGSGNEAGKEHH
jgi:hypothetical protein